VPLGYIAAVIGAALVVFFGTFGYPEARIADFFIAPILALVVTVGAASFLPAAVAIVVSELFRLRSVFYFLLVGGAIGLAIYAFAGNVGMIPVLARPVVYPAAGFVGGFIYWLIAGRDAGLSNHMEPEGDD
jgi:hypothetical protein